jgi:hypothetical protein
MFGDTPWSNLQGLFRPQMGPPPPAISLNGAPASSAPAPQQVSVAPRSAPPPATDREQAAPTKQPKPTPPPRQVGDRGPREAQQAPPDAVPFIDTQPVAPGTVVPPPGTQPGQVFIAQRPVQDQPDAPMSTSKKLWIAFFVVLGLAAAGGGVYWYVRRRRRLKGE